MLTELTIGFLHIGETTHGIRRFGEMTSAHARDSSQIATLDVALEPFSRPSDDISALIAAARRLSRADMIHVQSSATWRGSIWGSGHCQLQRMKAFFEHCTKPVITTVHDVRARLSISSLLSRRNWTLRTKPTWFDYVQRVSHSVGLDSIILNLLKRRTDHFIVCSQEELKRLHSRGLGNVTVIPHFVERVTTTESRGSIRERLGLRDRTAITLLGFIHRRKGHDVLLEAATMLPDNTEFILAGMPAKGWQWYVEQLKRYAKKNGISDRVRFTGFLSDADLHEILSATDIAVCPFSDVSASSSLSTLIAYGVPIVASELPLMHEYNTIVPGSIQTFSPFTAESLAQSLHHVSTQQGLRAADKMKSLQTALSPRTVAAQHVALYRDVIEGLQTEPVTKTTLTTVACGH